MHQEVWYSFSIARIVHTQSQNFIFLTLQVHSKDPIAAQNIDRDILVSSSTRIQSACHNKGKACTAHAASIHISCQNFGIETRTDVLLLFPSHHIKTCNPRLPAKQSTTTAHMIDLLLSNMN